jgi:hypothetical protein
MMTSYERDEGEKGLGVDGKERGVTFMMAHYYKSVFFQMVHSAQGKNAEDAEDAEEEFEAQALSRKEARAWTFRQ